jgi:hypothetical protein
MAFEPKPIVRSITSWYDSVLIIDETSYGGSNPDRSTVSTYCMLYNYMDNTLNSHVSGLVNTSRFATSWTANIAQPRGVGAGLYEVILIVAEDQIWPDFNTMTPDEVYEAFIDPDANQGLYGGYFPLLIIPNEYMDVINARQMYCEGIMNALPLQCDYSRIRALMTQLDYAAQLRDWDTALIAYQNLKNQFVV